jgi:alpha-1,6-mannosyltransferase
LKVFTKYSIITGAVASIFLLIIYFIGYETERTNFNQFILLYLAGFTLFYVLWLNRQQWNFKMFLAIAIIARLILLLAIPELSNDFFRFIWDGELMTKGINPYAHVPNELISQGPFYNDAYMRSLFHGMGELSQSNYSCYPVLNQLLFLVPTALFDSMEANVISLKVMLILADVGVIYIGRKILILLKKPVHYIWLYALNPFIILEFSGNLHFEGVMIFFMLLGIYFVMTERWIFGALFFAFAIQIKLIPILLIPFLFKKLRWRKSIGFTAMTTFVVIGMGAILINDAFLVNFMQSIKLYFGNFEFNASLYNLLEEYTFTTKGYSEIAIDGPFLSKIGIVLIMLLAIFRAVREDKQIFSGMMFALVIYYLFATTVHPWYISMILILSVFTNYKVGVIWSMLIMLSYFAYSNPAFSENMLFITIEYLCILVVLVFEIWRNTSKQDIGLQFKSFFSEKDVDRNTISDK